MHRRLALLPMLLLAYIVAACGGPLSAPVVDNRSDVAYLARVSGFADDGDTARIIELPAGVRTSLEHHAGLSDLFLHDVTILDAGCAEVGHFDAKDTFVGEGPGFPGSIVILPNGNPIRDETDSGSAGADAITSDRCQAETP